MTRVASFAPEQNEGANDATRDPINYVPSKSHVIALFGSQLRVIAGPSLASYPLTNDS